MKIIILVVPCGSFWLRYLCPLLPSLVLLFQKSSLTSQLLRFPFGASPDHFTSHCCSTVCSGARLWIPLLRKIRSPACPQSSVTPMCHWSSSELMACPRGPGAAKPCVSLLKAGGGQELWGECGACGKVERSSLSKMARRLVLGSGRWLLYTNEGPVLPGL